MPTILVCDDDKQIVEAINIYLTGEGFNVIKAYDGYEALELLEKNEVNLMIVDVMMPGLDGIRTTLKVRETSSIPIIILSAKSEDTDKILGLNIGADDYITKPFGGGELLARIRAALRHARNQVAGPSYTQTGVYRAGELCIDFDRHLVQLEGQDVHLTQSEYKIVSLLTRYAGKVLTYDFIIREIWGEKATGDTQNLRANMAKIRRKLEKNPGKPQYIFTEVGVGYRMAEGE